ncbi:MAG TPA: GNAT family N-acetyltransferase [Amnibacterium sp.]|jgi:GNAT superfamily N-acetyltransferase
MAHRIRDAVQTDAPFLADMLVEAFDWTAGHGRSRVELLADPVVNRYVRGWRRPGDGGVVAVDDHGAPLGACWYRVLPKRDAGYGWVGAGVPELTLGVRPIHRAKGVGRALLAAACDQAAGAGHQRISLSVERANFAWRLYISEGFVVVASGTDSDTMAKTLR